MDISALPAFLASESAAMSRSELLIVMTNVVVGLTNVLVFVVSFAVFRLELRKIERATKQNTRQIGALRRAVRALSLAMTRRRYRRRVAASGLANVVRSHDRSIGRINVINPSELHLVDTSRKANKS